MGTEESKLLYNRHRLAIFLYSTLLCYRNDPSICKPSASPSTNPPQFALTEPPPSQVSTASTSYSAMYSRPFPLFTALLLVSLAAIAHCEKTADEVPPWNHVQFRPELSHFEYYHGEWTGKFSSIRGTDKSPTMHASSNEVVSDFAYFSRWSFKSVRLDSKWYLVIGAGKDTNFSMLREKLLGRNRRAKIFVRRRLTSRTSERRSFRHVVKLHIPTQMPQVKGFDFAYVTGKSYDPLLPIYKENSEEDFNIIIGSNEGDVIIGSRLRSSLLTQFVALRWVNSFKGKKDWVFAIVSGSSSDLEFVPIGPRPSSPTIFSIRIENEELRIEVNQSLVFMRPSPWKDEAPLFRHTGVNLYQEPIQDLEANVFFSHIM